MFCIMLDVQANEIREEITAVTFRPRWVSIQCGKPMNTSTASPPNPLDVYAKMTLKFKDGEPPRKAT